MPLIPLDRLRKPVPMLMCGKCGHPVDELIETREIPSGNYILAAKCHGDFDVVSIPEVEMFSMAMESPSGRIKFEFGTAFRQYLLT